jgi:hypothetical protein
LEDLRKSYLHSVWGWESSQPSEAIAGRRQVELFVMKELTMLGIELERMSVRSPLLDRETYYCCEEVVVGPTLEIVDWSLAP